MTTAETTNPETQAPQGQHQHCSHCETIIASHERVIAGLESKIFELEGALANALQAVELLTQKVDLLMRRLSQPPPAPEVT